MILLIHDTYKIVQILDLDTNIEMKISFQNPVVTLFKIAKKNSERIIIWCHELHKDNLNLEAIKASFYIKNIMCSYSKKQYLPLQIGYVEDSPFININKKVKYPTWLMSANVGAIYASQLLKFKDNTLIKEPFEYALNSISKLGISNGLLCYSEPKLLKDNSLNCTTKGATTSTFFKFVKQHFKKRWTVLLFLNYIFYENKFPIISFINSLFYKEKSLKTVLKTKSVNSIIINTSDVSIDVIIPTIGRKAYLYNVLHDLSKQTLLPRKVIIIEQNPEINSSSELNYLYDNKWPFKITHQFIHKTGACNARNIALKNTNSDYIFFADDDIRFDENILHNTISEMYSYNVSAVTLSCLMPNDIEKKKSIIQWSSFGSGCSIVKSEALAGLTYDTSFEHGFGEDSDFGMQLRNKGTDILYFPHIKLLHLKATLGGFRTKDVNPWNNLKIEPKPSPTVMLNRIKNNSKQQLLGYKTVLFFKYYRKQKIKNPITYYKTFLKQWKQSVNLSYQLKYINN